MILHGIKFRELHKFIKTFIRISPIIPGGAAPGPPVNGAFFGPRYFGGRYFGRRYFG